MALLIVSEELVENEEVFELLINSFDSIEEVSRDAIRKTRTIRVQHAEIPKEDKVICPEMCEFEGVKPFIIEFDC